MQLSNSALSNSEKICQYHQYKKLFKKKYFPSLWIWCFTGRHLSEQSGFKRFSIISRIKIIYWWRKHYVELFKPVLHIFEKANFIPIFIRFYSILIDFIRIYSILIGFFFFYWKIKLFDFNRFYSISNRMRIDWSFSYSNENRLAFSHLIIQSIRKISFDFEWVRALVFRDLLLKNNRPGRRGRRNV